jgi:hypothetical protein
MSEDIYRKLARGLDAILPGLAATESGVELRLLEKYGGRGPLAANRR